MVALQSYEMVPAAAQVRYFDRQVKKHQYACESGKGLGTVLKKVSAGGQPNTTVIMCMQAFILLVRVNEFKALTRLTVQRA